MKWGTDAFDNALAVQLAPDTVIVEAVRLEIRPVLAPEMLDSIQSGAENVEVARVVPVPAAIVIVIPPTGGE